MDLRWPLWMITCTLISQAEWRVEENSDNDHFKHAFEALSDVKDQQSDSEISDDGLQNTEDTINKMHNDPRIQSEVVEQVVELVSLVDDELTQRYGRKGVAARVRVLVDLLDRADEVLDVDPRADLTRFFDLFKQAVESIIEVNLEEVIVWRWVLERLVKTAHEQARFSRLSDNAVILLNALNEICQLLENNSELSAAHSQHAMAFLDNMLEFNSIFVDGKGCSVSFLDVARLSVAAFQMGYKHPASAKRLVTKAAGLLLHISQHCREVSSLQLQKYEKLALEKAMELARFYLREDADTAANLIEKCSLVLNNSTHGEELLHGLVDVTVDLLVYDPSELFVASAVLEAVAHSGATCNTTAQAGQLLRTVTRFLDITDNEVLKEAYPRFTPETVFKLLIPGRRAMDNIAQAPDDSDHYLTAMTAVGKFVKYSQQMERGSVEGLALARRIVDLLPPLINGQPDGAVNFATTVLNLLKPHIRSSKVAQLVTETVLELTELARSLSRRKAGILRPDQLNALVETLIGISQQLTGDRAGHVFISLAGVINKELNQSAEIEVAEQHLRSLLAALLPFCRTNRDGEAKRALVEALQVLQRATRREFSLISLIEEAAMCVEMLIITKESFAEEPLQRMIDMIGSPEISANDYVALRTRAAARVNQLVVKLSDSAQKSLLNSRLNSLQQHLEL